MAELAHVLEPLHPEYGFAGGPATYCAACDERFTVSMTTFPRTGGKGTLRRTMEFGADRFAKQRHVWAFGPDTWHEPYARDT